MTSIVQQGQEQGGTLASSLAIPAAPNRRRRIKPREAGKSFLFKGLQKVG